MSLATRFRPLLAGAWLCAAALPSPAAAQEPVVRVIREDLSVTVTGTGMLQATARHEIRSELTGSTKLIWLAPEGVAVEAGDRVAELDASRLVERRRAQDVTVVRAEGAAKAAQAAVETAALALAEAERTTGVERARAALAIASARAEIEVAKLELERAEGAEQRVARAALDVARHSATLADAEAELAQTRGRRRAAAAQRDLAAARAAARAAAVALEQSVDEHKRLVTQIDHAVMRAPAAGTVVHARSGRGSIAAGQAVRKRQTILEIIDATKLLAHVQLSERDARKVARGQRAVIGVDAFAGHRVVGTVTRIERAPGRRTPGDPQPVRHSVLIGLPSVPVGARHGMSLRAEIECDRLAGVLTVPHSAIVRRGGATFVDVRRGATFERRRVTLGPVGDERVVVESGIAEGDVVRRAPGRE